MNDWPIRRRPRQIWVDPDFKKFIETEYPNAYNPERTRRLLDRYRELIYGKKKK